MQRDAPTSWLRTWTSDFTSLLRFLICKMPHPRHLGILTKIRNVKSAKQCLAHERHSVKEPFLL